MINTDDYTSSQRDADRATHEHDEPRRERAVAEQNRLTALGDSYANDYSNVAKLYRLKITSPTEELRIERRLYLDGIGTRRRQADSPFFGGGFAWGADGITSRCAWALGWVRGEAEGLSRRANCRNITLYLDLFGFSRGAAAARHFIHLIREADFTLFKVGQKNIRFVGLFDTVASHGPNHSNDVEDLHLNRLDSAQKVLQFAAADEFRVNFSLVDIASAVNGIQHYLPGSHSDVGGGYAQHMRETNWLLRDDTLGTSVHALNQDRLHLERMGYYNSREWLPTRYARAIYVTRSNPIDNRYSLVPLALMAEEIHGLSLDFLRFSGGRWSISADQSLMGIKTALRSKMARGPIPLSEWNQDQLLGTLRLTALRRAYFHFSARYNDGIAHWPRFVNNVRVREIFHG